MAQQLGRSYIGVDLSLDYLRMSQDRLGHTAMNAWVNGNGNKQQGTADIGSLPLFEITE